MHVRAAALSLSFLLVSCDRPSQHVYSSPPPASPKLPAGTTPAISRAPELPLGAMGPDAQLVAVADAATGAPVALGSITDSVDVLTLVTFGPAEWTAREGGRVELAVRGPSIDTTLVRALGKPAPSVAAQSFRLTGLKVGRYTTVVRLRLTDGRVLAESIPLALDVVAR
jgi:hypothetical protein